MRIAEGQLRRIIREELLREEVYGALAFVYTGSQSPPYDTETEDGHVPGFIPMIVNDDQIGRAHV